MYIKAKVDEDFEVTIVGFVAEFGITYAIGLTQEGFFKRYKLERLKTIQRSKQLLCTPNNPFKV